MILTALVLWFLTMGQQPPTPAADAFGIVKGIVVDPNGIPVQGAVVHESSDDGRPLGGRLFRTSTTTDADGNFVLDQVVPAKKVVIWAYKYDEYYEDVMEPFTFKRPPNLNIPVVEVKPGQTVSGVRIQFGQKVGKLHLLVHDARTRELVHGIFQKLCPEGYPNNCLTGSDQSDSERMISLDVGVSIEVEADDGQHKEWKYRNPKNGSPYFRSKSGETETINIFLGKK